MIKSLQSSLSQQSEEITKYRKEINKQREEITNSVKISPNRLMRTPSSVKRSPNSVKRSPNSVKRIHAKTKRSTGRQNRLYFSRHRKSCQILHQENATQIVKINSSRPDLDYSSITYQLLSHSNVFGWI